MNPTSLKPRVRPKTASSSAWSAALKPAVVLFSQLERHFEGQRARHAISALALCPAGSCFEDAVLITAKDTDLPPSLAFFAMITRVGAALAQHHFVVQLPDGQLITPNPWVICLAPSGAGKTFARCKIADAITACLDVQMLPESFTTAYMFSYLSGTGLTKDEDEKLTPEERTELLFRRCRALLNRDEIAEFLKRINTSEVMAEMKDYLLRSYDNAPISRATLTKGEATTLPVALTIYGTAVHETCFSSLREEDFLNGLAQRFLWLLAMDRPDTRIALYQLPDVPNAQARFVTQWQRAQDGPRTYSVTSDAVRVYSAWFERAWGAARDHESYVRRYGFAAFRYALILRAMTEPDGVIDAATVEQALRIIDRHLEDLFICLRDYTSVSPFHGVLKRIEAYLASHPEATRGLLLRNVRGIGPARLLDEFLETLALIRDDAVGARAQALRSQARRGTAQRDPYSTPSSTSKKCVLRADSNELPASHSATRGVTYER